MKWGMELDLAAEAAREAGILLRDAGAETRRTLSAEGRDIKLQADRQAEEVILARLEAAGLPILSEESGETGAVGADPAWIVDPLDGTMNYSRGLPLSCVSIGLWAGETPLLGVVYDFSRNEMFCGIVGEGAWLNGRSMRVAPLRPVNQAIILTGFPTLSAHDDASLRALIALAQRYKKTRMIGSAALSLAYVACGRADIYVENDIQHWDIAAGVALALAAGGWALIEPSPRGKWARMARCAAHSQLWKEGSQP